MTPEPFDLPHLVADVLADVQAAAHDRGLRIAAARLSALPQWVEGDEASLRRMLLNTLDLVVGAATGGTVLMRLDPHPSQADRWTCVVAWRADADSAVEEVKSAFVVTLRPAEVGNDGGPLRILVVDDSAQHRSMITAYLTTSAHVVTEADSGEAALDQIRTNPFDVILMDVQMPGMDGVQAIRLMRSHESLHAHTPSFIVALTTMGADADAANAAAAGADICMTKPVGRGALVRVLADVPRRVDLGQLLTHTRHELGAILQSTPDTQVERLRTLGRTLATSAATAGLREIAQLASALDHATATGSLHQSQSAARTLQAWVLRTQA